VNKTSLLDNPGRHCATYSGEIDIVGCCDIIRIKMEGSVSNLSGMETMRF